MGKDVLSKIRSNDVYKALVRVLDEYGATYEVEDKRPHPVLTIAYVGLAKEYKIPSTPRPRVNLKRYVSDLRRFLQAMQYEALELERQHVMPSKVGQVHVPMQGSLFVPADINVDDISLSEIDGEPRARDLDIAERLGFERPRAIRQLIERNIVELQEFGLIATRRGAYRGSNFTEYWLTEEQALSIAARSETERAAKVRNMLIRVFVSWRKGQLQPVIDLSDPAWLRGQLLSYTERVLSLENTVAAQQPKVEAFERIADADGSMCITDAAKNLQIKPKDLFRWLEINRWTYIRAGTSTRLSYQAKINQGYLTHKIKTIPRNDGNDIVSTQVRILPKGLTVIAETFSN